LDKIHTWFELCHFLDDDKFLIFLINELLLKYYWTHCSEVLDKLHNSVLYDVYLHLPYNLLPTTYQTNLPFLVIWINNNNHKTFNIGYKYVFRADFIFYDANNSSCTSSIGKINNVTSWYSERSEINWFERHGTSRNWYPVNHAGKQLLHIEETYKYGKCSGDHIIYYDNDNNHVNKITHYVNEHIVTSTQYYDTGLKSSQSYYDNNSNRTGTWQGWYPSGRVKYTMSYLHDTRHGYYRKYFDVDPMVIDDTNSVNNVNVNNVNNGDVNTQPIKRQYHFKRDNEVGTFTEWYYNETTGKHTTKYEYTYLGYDKYHYKQWDIEGNLVHDVTNNNAPWNGVTIPPYSNRKFFGNKNWRKMKASCKYTFYNH